MKIFQTSSLFERNKIHHGEPPFNGGHGAIAPVATPLNPALVQAQTQTFVEYQDKILANPGKKDAQCS